MIRRDVRLSDGTPGWALISQIEHARISALLASQCEGRFGPANSSLVRDEVLVAIAAHDDGWAEWEQTPQLDAKHGWPLSFMELAVGEATAIWSKSIAVAEEIGPLAAWMVSGHFMRLLEHSEHAKLEPLAQAWLSEISPCREAWFARWQAIEPELRNAVVAAEAFDWLWAFDEMSLWFCCRSPTIADEGPTGRTSRLVGHGTSVELRLESASPDESASGSPEATATPWRFDRPALELSTPAKVLPVARYESVESLFAAATATTLRWRLSAGVLRD